MCEIEGFRLMSVPKKNSNPDLIIGHPGTLPKSFASLQYEITGKPRHELICHAGTDILFRCFSDFSIGHMLGICVVIAYVEMMLRGSDHPPHELSCQHGLGVSRKQAYRVQACSRDPYPSFALDPCRRSTAATMVGHIGQSRQRRPSRKPTDIWPNTL